jgi:hypothetical protein
VGNFQPLVAFKLLGAIVLAVVSIMLITKALS